MQACFCRAEYGHCHMCGGCPTHCKCRMEKRPRIEVKKEDRKPVKLLADKFHLLMLCSVGVNPGVSIGKVVGDVIHNLAEELASTPGMDDFTEKEVSDAIDRQMGTFASMGLPSVW